MRLLMEFHVNYNGEMRFDQRGRPPQMTPGLTFALGALSLSRRFNLLMWFSTSSKLFASIAFFLSCLVRGLVLCRCLDGSDYSSFAHGRGEAPKSWSTCVAFVRVIWKCQKGGIMPHRASCQVGWNEGRTEEKKKKTEKGKTKEVLKSYRLLEVVFYRRKDLPRMLTYLDSWPSSLTEVDGISKGLTVHNWLVHCPPNTKNNSILFWISSPSLWLHIALYSSLMTCCQFLL